jgi:MoxR-like ATPase
VEARQDTTVVIHPRTDHRRTLPLDKKGELIEAHEDFQLVVSCNPGYRSLMKDLKQSTKQRFGALDFDYPAEDIEIAIVSRKSGVDKATAEKLVQISHRARNLKGHGLDEGISTRLLAYAGHHLLKQPERRKLLLLVTDGEPADIDERDPQHLRHDTKKADEELYSTGVLTYCLTLDPNADAYVKRIFGENNYTVVDNVDRLPEKPPTLFASLTG